MTATATTRDAFLGGRFHALQPEDGPRSGIDAIFLAAAVPIREGAGETLLEAGAGVGVVSLAVAARVSDASVTAVEIQPELAALAIRNAAENGYKDRVHVVEADVTAPGGDLAAAGLARDSFEHVAANPPYYDPARSRPPAGNAKVRAHQARPDELEGWMRFCAGVAAPGASLTVIHRPESLSELLAAIGARFGGVELFPLFPAAGKAASRVLVRAVKGSRAPLAMRRGLVLHDSDGAFTPRAEGILRRGDRLDFTDSD